jgi:hypothetical protein
MKKPKIEFGIVCHRSGLYSWSDGDKEVFFSKEPPPKSVISKVWYTLGEHARRKLGHYNQFSGPHCP